jgi:hypothetical protein
MLAPIILLDFAELTQVILFIVSLEDDIPADLLSIEF